MRNPSSASVAAASSSTSKTPCCSKLGLKRGPWTPEEDELLSTYIRREGEGRWRTLPKRAGLLRCGKSCRLRWMNYLRPSVKRGQIAPDEEDLILRLHRLLGNRWSLIAGRIPGRTDNEIKNYWNTHLSKKLISQGIDPRTHKPLNPSSSEDVHAPAPKANNNPNPNSNPNSSGLDETGSSRRIILDKGSGYFKGTKLNQDYSGVVGDGHENWRNSDGLMMGLQNSHGNSNEEEDDMDYCTDDLFSSFLNSLINEDMFANQQQQQQQQQQSNVIAPSLDPLLPSPQTFGGYGTIWEAALTSSTAALNDNQQKWFVDHANKHP